MATIKKIDGKTGASYKITVTRGRDLSGKQIRHHKTWTPDPKMKERQMEKEAQRLAYEFERAIDLGYDADNRQTFAEYAEYVLDLKTRSGAKYRTVASYRNLLERINPAIGHMKIADIRPQHINTFYKQLSAPGARKGADKATAKADIPALMKEKKLTRLAAAEKTGLSPNTITEIRRGETVSRKSAERFSKLMGVRTETLFTIKKDERLLSSKTILEYHRCIHSILTQAEKELLVPYNAASKATPPKVSKKEVNYFQPSDLTAILDALETEPIKWRTITHLLIVSGCRRGEIMGLKWSKVDFKNSQIKIDSSLLYEPGRGIYENATKTEDTRFLKLPAESMALLRDYRQWYVELRFKTGDRWNDTDYVFVRDDGSPMQPDSISAWLGKFSKRHDLPHINPHAFRHTVASVLINNGQDIVTVSKRLGHSRTSTTLDVYSHIVREADEQASECIADVLLRKQA